MEALQKNKATRSATAEVATILESEPSLDPKQMRSLIDDRITLAANNSKSWIPVHRH